MSHTPTRRLDAAPDLKTLMRRSRIYTLPSDRLLDLFSARGDRWFQFRLSEPLPGDAVVTAVSYAFERDCYLLRVTSRSFDEVPEHMMLPEYGPVAYDVRWETEVAGGSRVVGQGIEFGPRS